MRLNKWLGFSWSCPQWTTIWNCGWIDFDMFKTRNQSEKTNLWGFNFVIIISWPIHSSSNISCDFESTYGSHIVDIWFVQGVTKVQQPGVSKCRQVAIVAPPCCH